MSRDAYTGWRLRRRLVPALVVALLVALVVPLPAAASAAQVSDEAVEALVDDLGISADEAKERLEAQPEQTALARRLSDQLGARAAGTWIDEATGELRVNVLDAAAARQVEAAGAAPKRVDTSLDRLERAEAELARGSIPEGAALTVDVPANALVLNIPRGSNAAGFIADAKALGVPVRVERVAAAVVPQAFYGGQEIRGSGWLCSAGFIAASGNTQYVVTAGHCTELSPTWTTSSGQTIGPAAGSSFPGNDYGRIQISNPSALQPVGAVINGGGITDITSVGRPPVGSTVCKTGRTTATTCGQIQAYNVTVNYQGSGTVSQLIQTNLCTQGGDSGGALFAGSTAVGITSGGLDAPCSTPGFVSFFQPVDEALGAYGLTLQ
jgi:hypothetical protein